MSVEENEVLTLSVSEEEEEEEEEVGEGGVEVV